MKQHVQHKFHAKSGDKQKDPHLLLLRARATPAHTEYVQSMEEDT